jgi:hypothetical protein
MNKTSSSEYSTTNNQCYTDLKFTVSGIAGHKLNISGTDEMMWAANNIDTFAQYHAKNRGVFQVEWKAASNLARSDARANAIVLSLTLAFFTAAVFNK